jgi:signal transduction histidine kinase
MSGGLDSQRMASLLAVGRTLVAELDPDAVLDRILSAACEIIGARYAALGILDAQRTSLERFVTLGIDEPARTRIGELPRGRGVLGALIRDPQPLRLTDVAGHPQSYGFPEGHPPMHSFLGVPVVMRGVVWGNLYLTEKLGAGEFTAADEEAAVILADVAATAIENARLYQASERSRVEQGRAVRGLEATRDIATAVGSETDLDRVLELIVERGVALVDARSVVILLREGDELVVTASAGETTDVRGHRLSIAGSTSGQVLERRRPERVDAASELRVAARELGVPDARTVLMVPMAARGESIGVLAAFDRKPAGTTFTADDELLLTTVAASAANAVAIGRSVESERLRSSMAAADAERAHWARELHDETLQGLGALRLLLAAARRRGDAEQTERSIDEAIEQIEREIENLHAIITDLRPATLDELGLRPTLESLLQRRRDGSGLEITSALALPDPGSSAERLAPEIETAVYRLVQEALTNIVKHAQASTVHVDVAATPGKVSIAISDDGVGFSTQAKTSGYGLAGMRERIYLVGGTLTLDSSVAGGTTVRADLPTGPPPAPAPAV